MEENKLKMKYFTLFIFSLNVLSVFSQLSNDCQRIESFFIKYKEETGSNILVPECCLKSDKYHYIDCDDNGDVIDM